MLTIPPIDAPGAGSIGKNSGIPSPCQYAVHRVRKTARTATREFRVDVHPPDSGLAHQVRVRLCLLPSAHAHSLHSTGDAPCIASIRFMPDMSTEIAPSFGYSH